MIFAGIHYSFAVMVLLWIFHTGHATNWINRLFYRKRLSRGDLFTEPQLLQTETIAPDLNQFLPNTMASVPAVFSENAGLTIQGPKPAGSYEVIGTPAKVAMTIAAKNVELVCSAFGDYTGSIRWVRLKGRHHNVQEFEVIAEGNNVFDPDHYAVTMDDESMSRLHIQNLDPEMHYGVYQCQVSLNGIGSYIQKLDFAVGKPNQ